MTHRALAVPGPGPNLMILHSAGTTPEQMAALVGPVDGFNVIYPEAAKDLRWDHLGEADASFLEMLGGDFIAGYSSGGFMAARMLAERQYRGGMLLAAGFLKSLRPTPSPLMVVHGTDDHRVAYRGSEYVLGAIETAISMRNTLGIAAGPTRTLIPNRSKADLCTANVDDWEGKVKLYTVLNGGHTWPGTKWRDPLNRLGRTGMDFSATDAMREFFAAVA